MNGPEKEAIVRARQALIEAANLIEGTEDARGHAFLAYGEIHKAILNLNGLLGTQVDAAKAEGRHG